MLFLNQKQCHEKTCKKYCSGHIIRIVNVFSLSIIFSTELLYGCTTWTLTKRLEKKLDGNYIRILNKSWRQHPTRHQLYGHLPPITKTIQARRIRPAGHCWRSRDELISDVLLWTPTYGLAKAGRPALTYIQQLCEDTGCGHRRWTIGRSGERGSGISVLAARNDDDDDLVHILIMNSTEFLQHKITTSSYLSLSSLK